MEGFFLRTFDVGFQSGQSGRNHWPDQGPSNGAVIFYIMHDFRQSSEALRLSQVSKMLLQLSGQISAHCSSSEIRNTHLCLFRPDRDRDEKSGRKPSAIDDSDRGAISPIAPRTSAKNAKRSTTAIAERSLPSRLEIRPKTLSDRCHRAAKSGQKR